MLNRSKCSTTTLLRFVRFNQSLFNIHWRVYLSLKYSLMYGPSKNTQFDSGECSTISFLHNHETKENILVYREIKDFASRSFESNIQTAVYLGICGKV